MTITDKPTALTLRRTFAASAERLFAAWTDPRQLRRWMAPGSLGVSEATLDPVVGGELRVVMEGDGAERHVVCGTIREIEPPRRLVSTWRWEGSDEESLLTVELDEREPGVTELVLTHARFADAESRDRHAEGWTGCLAKLADVVPLAAETTETGERSAS